MPNVVEKQQLALTNNPLLVTTPTNEELLFWKDGKTSSLFTGIGFVTASQVSIGLPLDILGVILTAELIRRTLNINQVILWLADEHALLTQPQCADQIKFQVSAAGRKLTLAVKNLKLTRFVIIQASEIHQKNGFKNIVSNLENIINPYLKLEIADTIWLQDHLGVRAKLGWTMSKVDRVGGYDERFFDSQIKILCPALRLFHIKPGHNLHPNRPRVSPYLSLPDEVRLMLNKKEKVAEKLTWANQAWLDSSWGGGHRHLSHIIRLWENQSGPLEQFLPFADKLTILLNQTLQ